MVWMLMVWPMVWMLLVPLYAQAFKENHQTLITPIQAQAIVDEILKTVPLFDGHNDLPWQMRKRFKNQLSKIDLNKDTSDLKPIMHTDLPRLRKGGVQAQFWSVYVPFYSPAESFLATVEQIDVVKRLVKQYHNDLALATSADEVESIHKAGKIASLIGMEGGHSMGHSLAALRQLYDLGARYMTLTHNQTHLWADAAADQSKHQGLSTFGEQVVLEMNRLGMIVDLSHTSEDTMKDALTISKAPVIFSHSATKAICQHHRNASDDVLQMLKKNQGVMMVIFLPSFLNCQRRDWEKAKEKINTTEQAQWLINHPMPKVGMSDVIAHIDHIRQLIGIDHIALGGDFDGMQESPDGLDDVSGYRALLVALILHGYSRAEIEKIVGRNLLRVMRAVEIQRDLMKSIQEDESFGLSSPWGH
jgi:membrane dipeptidase